jgi:hypothetical protein
MIKITSQNKEMWLRLYRAAEAFRDLAPWEWMYDSHLFGIKDPKSGETNYGCIMGNAREVFALGLYLGKSGLKSYLRLYNNAYDDDTSMADRIAESFSQLMLKAEFVNRDEIESFDRKVFADLGLKYRGNNQWVQLRFVKPNYLPWAINDEQAETLLHALEQAVIIAKNFQKNPDLLPVIGQEPNIFVRIPRQENGEMVWVNGLEALPELEEEQDIREIHPTNVDIIAKTKKTLKKHKVSLCFYHAHMHTPIQENKYAAPRIAKLALWVAYGNGSIIGTEVIDADESRESIERKLIKHLMKIGVKPANIIGNSNFACETIAAICEALDIPLHLDPDLEEFSDIEKSFMQFLDS